MSVTPLTAACNVIISRHATDKKSLFPRQPCIIVEIEQQAIQSVKIETENGEFDSRKWGEHNEYID